MERRQKRRRRFSLFTKAIGVFEYANGDHYEGDWSGDKKNGKGVMKHKDGTKYDGEWKDDLKEGEGNFKLSTLRSSYISQW